MAQLPLSFDEAPTRDFRAADKLPSYIRDHRKRLRERFMRGGAEAVPDYELLELILFRANARQDMKPVARRLFETFGDLAGVLAASDERLQDIEGVGPAVVTELRIMEAAAQRLSRSRVLSRHAISGWDALVKYCRTAMAHASVESFRVLYLDRQNFLISDEEVARGTVDHVPVYPREVVRRALLHNASALILVHNHPSGDPTPSEADILMTEQVAKAAAALSITLHDHIVVGAAGERSFRAEGLL